MPPRDACVFPAPGTPAEFTATASPRVHTRAVDTEVVVVSEHTDEVPERVRDADIVARVAVPADGLLGILDAHVFLRVRVLLVAAQAYVQQRPRYNRAVVRQQRHLLDVLELLVLE